MWKSVHSLLADEEAETEAHRRRMMDMKEGKRFIESSGMSENFSGGLVDNVLSLSLSFSPSFLLSLMTVPSL